MMLFGATSSLWPSIMLWSFAAMGIYGYVSPFWSLPNEFLSGYAAASGIALVNSVGNLGGFVGPSIIGALASGEGGIYRGLTIAGVSLLVSATLVLMLPSQNPATKLAGSRTFT